MNTTRPRFRNKTLMLLVVVGVVIPFGMAPHIRTFPSHPYRVIEERDASDTVTRQIVYAHGQPLWQILSDGSSQYYHEDPRGNVVALTAGVGGPTAPPGEVLERYTYDPHGKPLFQDAANQDKLSRAGIPLDRSEFQNTLLFRGQWYDAALGARSASVNSDFGGMYLVEGGYYNPDTGRGTARRLVDGDPDRPIVGLGWAVPGSDQDGGASVNPYTWLAGAPVNGCAAPLCGEVWLGGGGAGAATASGLPTGKRQHKPVNVTKPVHKATSRGTGADGLRQGNAIPAQHTVVRKRPGRTTYANITLDRQASGASEIRLDRDGFHRASYAAVAAGGSPDRIGAAPPRPTGIEHEDIGVCDDCGSVDPVPVGIEHEDIGICPPDVCPPVNPIPLDLDGGEPGFVAWSATAPGEAGAAGAIIGLGAQELCCGTSCSCPPTDCCGVSCSCQPPESYCNPDDTGRFGNMVFCTNM